MLSIAENPMNFTPGAVGFDPLKMYAKADEKERRNLEVCIYMCVYVCVHAYGIHLYGYLCLCVFMHMHICICMYVYIYVYAYV
jgi:hypothetical protein